ncbi:MAG: apiosidase-like domain-containing protein [Planctomycetota bacterium]
MLAASRWPVLAVAVVLVSHALHERGLREHVARDAATAPHRGVYEITLRGADLAGIDPWFSVGLQVVYTRPDQTEIVVDGYYDGNDRFRSRAYCDQIGTWSWRTKSSLAALDGQRGSFQVASSDLKGKLRKHPEDPRQLAYDNGQWFLHVGDTGYRFVTATEPKWKEYIDQAAKMGATKIRTWFCQGRSDVQILFNENRDGLNLPYWQEIDRRVTYAFDAHPEVVLQMIPYGEDTRELLRYGDGDAAAQLVARYAQARFSAFPNVLWCISNDREIVSDDAELKGRRVPRGVIDRIGHDMAAREPWGTLLTNHQCRFSGYSFVDSPWSDVITIEDLDQVNGRIIAEYRDRGEDPVVNDEDRYELYRSPRDPRYFFRRLMWASLLSGGSATYGGLKTYEAYDGELRGVQGYFTAVAKGKLTGGAEDFRRIHQFFRDTGLTLVGMTPDDGCVGEQPHRFKCTHDDRTYLVYLANPSGDKPETDTESAGVPSVTIQLPARAFTVFWFDPATGTQQRDSSVRGGRRTLTAPGSGDWILVLRRAQADATSDH